MLRAAAAAKLSLPAEFEAILAEPTYRVRGAFPTRPWPSCEWIIALPGLSDSPVAVELSTSVRISKLAPAFAVLHHFMIPFHHPSAIMPFFAGESGRPFSQAQFALHERLVRALGYAGLGEVTEGMSLRYVSCGPVGPGALGNECVSFGAILFGDPLGALEEGP
ncbi:MAG: hypothetical protein AB7O44_26415 [Hyphomicrobiaceae bacterium]